MALEPYGSKLIPFIVALIFLSLMLQHLNKKSQPKPHENDIHQFQTRWYDVLKQEFEGKKINISLVNMDDGVGENYDQMYGLAEKETVTVLFDRVSKDLQWSDFFPKRIDEDEKEGRSSCPEIPMPKFEDYHELNVVVARVPCTRGAGREGVKDVFRLQLNLVVANLLVRSGWKNHNHQVDRTVYAVFIGSCGPMREIFRCEDLLMHEDDFFVYRPHLGKLKKKVLMPVGTCQVAPHKELGEEMRRYELSETKNTLSKSRNAYVTLLHSDSFVCGAITLAQSIIQTNTTNDLVLLADDSISKMSLQGLKAAGWKIKHIKLIRSPHAERKVYNEWTYSKLQVWQLTEYDKILYIDADAIVVENIDDFFVFPQLSAVGDVESMFNAGIMLVEPSECTFEILMEKMYKVASYDASDQGFLNEMFTWWHRWPSTLNRLKLFDEADNKNHVMTENPRVIHYVGIIKPWMCQTDYDCTWDIPGPHQFASDSVHQRWLQVYKALPKTLQLYCELTVRYDPTLAKIRMWIEGNKDASSLQRHWKIFLIFLLFVFFLFLLLNNRSLNLLQTYGSCIISCLPVVRRKEKVNEEECHGNDNNSISCHTKATKKRW